jgi:hypothetical protein
VEEGKGTAPIGSREKREGNSGNEDVGHRKKTGDCFRVSVCSRRRGGRDGWTTR